MPFLGLLIVALQITFVVHAVKTGRETFWFYIIVFVPGFGCAAYFLTQVLPELGSSRTVRRAGTSVRKAVDPARDLRQRRAELDVVDTIDNRVKLAAEYAQAGHHGDARDMLDSCRERGHADDPYVLLPLAHSHFGLGNFAEARNVLDHLIASNPTFKSHDGHLLYARSLEALDQLDDAAREYTVLSTSYPGEEARVRYGYLLTRLGKRADAERVFVETLARANRAPKYYRKQQRAWINQAREALSGL